MRLRRSCAYLVDVVLWALLASPALLSCAGTSWANHQVPGSGAYWIAYLSFLACNAPQVLTGASVGHRLFSLRITGLAGNPAPFSRRLVRTVVKYLPVHLIVLSEGFGLAANDPWRDLITLLILGGLLLLACSLLTVGRTRGARAIHNLCAGTAKRGPAASPGFPVIPIAEAGPVRA